MYDFSVSFIIRGATWDVRLRYTTSDKPFPESHQLALSKLRELVQARVNQGLAYSERNGQRFYLRSYLNITQKEYRIIQGVLEESESRIMFSEILTVKDLSNLFAGVGDTISFGLTEMIREVLDIDGGVDQKSSFYRSGEVYGNAVNFLTEFLLGSRTYAELIRAFYGMQEEQNKKTEKEDESKSWISEKINKLKKFKRFFRVGYSNYGNQPKLIGNFPKIGNVPRIAFGDSSAIIKMLKEAGRNSEQIEKVLDWTHIDLRFRPLDTVMKEFNKLNPSQQRIYIKALRAKGKLTLVEKLTRLLKEIK